MTSGPEAVLRGRHRVVVLLQDGFIPFELGIPHRIFGRARDAGGHDLYDVVTAAVTGPGAVRSDSDVVVLAEHGPQALADADTLVVPASSLPGPVREEGRLTPALEAAFAHLRPGTRLMSICVGSFVLAAAGFLDGRPATTHWADAELMARLFPRVRVQPDVLYVDDGDVLTSAGVAAGVDLCLHVVRRDHGAAVADDVARRTVVPPHRDGGQAQYVRRSVPVASSSGTGAARAWALDHLAEPLSLEDLAARCAMSVRTFTRRFRDETGQSPGQWLTAQRVEAARHLLEDSGLGLEQIAARCGFGTAQSLRAHVQAALGVTPTQYRRTFRRAA
ncbi:transcriptional regulator, AraC family [Xylanimonas cellulosilytica DSM 15894]|uniref:Transcriptional regulator, AraC family n=1 Tax=Xylanimonas cellulosilytica (strain DSM 15894 / JCM 12276 / CECT 5975 / KCTC 9989 / LMG 20990 / NBRC 107835 / XIL07) TaxID=446471 RepID=D1BV68_XYLCX|nr:helix-turn-helix domain-containing protein [Xylanimonas cellulosilytica]ACZ31307.1 transcriptional regulator, AraC family [Xylanimonas cellulosilytica DSM 15894]